MSGALIQYQRRMETYPCSSWYTAADTARDALDRLLAEPSGLIWLRILHNPPLGPEKVWRWSGGTFTRTEDV